MRIPAILVRKPVIKKSWYVKDDPQAHKVSLMEREIIGWCVETHHSREFLESVSRHACRKWGVEVAPIKIRSSKEHVYARCYDDHIWLNSSKNKTGANLGTLVHELAHWIVDRVYNDINLPFHGPEFVLVYGKLLDRYKLFPLKYFTQLCEDYGVEIADEYSQQDLYGIA